MFAIIKLIILTRFPPPAMSANLRVHIAPVGFEFRRVTEPLIGMQADKVYLVTFEANDKAQKFYSSVKKELADNYKHIRVEEVFVKIWDLYACLEAYRVILLKERDAGNHVYVNVSTGTKVTAMAGMLSCMLWGASPYYAQVSYPPSSYAEVPPTEYVRDSEVFPVYEIKKPKPEHLLVLEMLSGTGGKARKAKLIDELESKGIIRLRDETKDELTEAAKHSQLRAILDPMENEWQFIRVESSGRRSEVFITDKGATALKIFGSAPENHRRSQEKWKNRG